MKISFKRELTDEKLLNSLYIKIFWSSVIAIICSCIGQIVGNIVVGNVLGEEKLAVTSLTLPIYYIFATIGNLMGIGGSTLCAKLIGKHKNDECKKVFTVTYFLTAFFCILFSVLVIVLLPQIVGWLGTPKNLIDDIKIYSKIISLGGVFTAGIYLSFNLLRLDDKPIATTMTFVIMAVVNVLLDVVLRNWGVAGIAVASVAGSAVATVFGLFALLFKSETFGFCKVSTAELKEIAFSVFKVGSPGATENVSILMRSYLMNQLIVSIVGVAALSSFSAVNSVNSFSQAITVGCAGALMPLIGVFSAERDIVSIRRMIRSAVRVGMGVLLPFIVLVVVFAPQISVWFGFADGLEAAAQAIRLFAISLPFALLSNVLIYVHLANNHTVIANVLTALRCLFLAVGCAFVLSELMGEIGLWFSFAITEIGMLLVALFLHIGARKKNRNLSLSLLLDRKFENNGATIALTVFDQEESISAAMQQLTDFCEQNDLSPKQTMIITLSLDEMVHMAAEHSTRSHKQHIIGVRVLIAESIMIMRLRYAGEMFNPIAYYKAKKTDTTDVEGMLEMADCLGIKMVIDTCDVVDYRTTFGINNLTVISDATVEERH